MLLFLLFCLRCFLCFAERYFVIAFAYLCLACMLFMFRFVGCCRDCLSGWLLHFNFLLVFVLWFVLFCWMVMFCLVLLVVVLWFCVCWFTLLGQCFGDYLVVSDWALVVCRLKVCFDAFVVLIRLVRVFLGLITLLCGCSVLFAFCVVWLLAFGFVSVGFCLLTLFVCFVTGLFLGCLFCVCFDFGWFGV